MIKNGKFKNIYIYISQKLNIQNFKENPTSRPVPSVCKWNKIINLFLSVKLWRRPVFRRAP